MSAPVVFQITILGNELVGLLSFLVLQHRVSHLHIFAAELVPGQDLYDSGSDGVSQNVGGGPETVPAATEKTARLETQFSCPQQEETLRGTEIPSGRLLLLLWCGTPSCLSSRLALC